ncbi:MAG: hypothetical protein OET44_08520 [Gammaproteobacteria bacterium]|nr:hypothetical protein [Gammaproteobacteria bacterium]
MKFYLGGKAELLGVAAQINTQCNADGSCPTELAGWQAWNGAGAPLSRGSMLYFVSAGEGNDDRDGNAQHPAFRLVYRFFLPDHWFEARGGIGKSVTSGWKSRETSQ